MRVLSSGSCLSDRHDLFSFLLKVGGLGSKVWRFGAVFLFALSTRLPVSPDLALGTLPGRSEPASLWLLHVVAPCGAVRPGGPGVGQAHANQAKQEKQDALDRKSVV